MYGLRWIGLGVSTLASIALGLQLFLIFSTHQVVSVVALGLEATNVAMLFVWILWVNENSVRRGADVYAERLFETLDASIRSR